MPNWRRFRRLICGAGVSARTKKPPGILEINTD
jgi:hypothetical protein